MPNVAKSRMPSCSESGFTLIEALVATVVLAVGLVSLTNLLVVSSASNQVATQMTAATDTARATLETLKAQAVGPPALGPYLVPGGDPTFTTDVPTTCTGTPTYCSDALIPGVGRIHTRWVVINENTAGTTTYYIEVRAQGTSQLSRERSMARFTTFRTVVGGP